MITEDFVSFEVAKLLKEKGFNGEWHKHYWGYEPGNEFLTSDSYNSEYDYPAPTLQMAMKYLREVHNINIGILFNHLRDFKTHWNFYIEGIELGRESMFFHTYEEACEASIKYCLENLI